MNRSPETDGHGASFCGGSGGFTLVEVLLVCALAATILAGAWAWVWTMAAAGRRVNEATEARTSLAYVRRMLLADLRVAVGLDMSSPCSRTSVSLAVPSAHHADGRVVVTWNRQRGILWRVAPACHLADGVEWFSVRYIDVAGRQVGGLASALLPEEMRAVAGVVVEVRIRAGRAVCNGRWPVWFGGQGP